MQPGNCVKTNRVFAVLWTSLLLLFVWLAFVLASAPTAATASGGLVLTDEHNDFSKVFAASGNMALSTSGPERYDNDPVRFYNNTHGEGYFIYEVPGAAQHVFSGFTLTTWYTPNSSNEFPGDMSFQVSADNISYTALTGVLKTIDTGWTSSNWTRIFWETSVLPPGTKYVKIVMGDTSNHPSTWPIQVGSTTLRYQWDGDALNWLQLQLADEHDDFAKVYAKTGNMATALSGPERFDDDPVRFYKTSHAEGYFIYEVPDPGEHVFTGFDLTTWYTPNSNEQFPGDMSFQVSADNVTYKPVADVRKTIDPAWTSSNWTRIYWDTSSLPSGTKYVKIVMGDTSNHPSTWPIQVGRTVLRYAAELVDDHDGLQLLHAASSNMGMSTSGPERFDHDPVRFYKTTHDEGYFIYEVPRAETRIFTGFELTTWYTKNSSGEYPGDMSFQVSTDDVTYTPFNGFRKIIDPTWTSSNWTRIFWRANGLPAGTKYVKIVMGDTTNYPATWPIQVGRTALFYAPDVRTVLPQLIGEAETVRNNATIGTAVGTYPQAAANALSAVIAAATAIHADTGASQLDAENSYTLLLLQLDSFERSLIRALNWEEHALITAANTTWNSITLQWPQILEAAAHPELTYEIYQDGQSVATTASTSHIVSGLKPQMAYHFSIVARDNGDSSLPLGPVALMTANVAPVPAPNFNLIDPEDFADEDYLSPLVWVNDRRAIPFYFTHFHTVANAVRMDEPNRGFIDIVVHRTPASNQPYNARVQENQLWLTYFYSQQADWNLYYGMPEVGVRLEAVLEHLLKLQNTDGTFSVYGWGDTNNLAGATFVLHFLTESLRLLHEAKLQDPGFPSIDPLLYDRVLSAVGHSLERLLHDERHWNHGRAYTNQYTMLWATVMGYLAFVPDEELETQMMVRFHQSEDEFISPAGFYYEANGLDMSYNLSVHLQNLIGEYNYFRNTPYVQDLIDKESTFFNWLSYNLVIEPDGSSFTTNGSPSRRTPSSAFDRKDIPLAQQLPIARAFVRTDTEVAADIAAMKAAVSDGTWPNVPNLRLNGGNAYNPYGSYNRIMYNYHPTETERNAAIAMLPYIASDRFNHQRVDDRSNMEFTYVRRPGYYAIFNAGPGQSTMQSFGLGLLWHPQGGILLSSQTEDTATVRGLAWGTRKQGNSRNYENGTVQPTYTLNGNPLTPQVGYGDLASGTLALQYNLGQAGSKKVTFTETGMSVDIDHTGGFTERLPLMVLDTDTLVVAGNSVTLTRGDVQMTITFDASASASIQPLSFRQYAHRMHMLTLTASGELDYTVTLTVPSN